MRRKEYVPSAPQEEFIVPLLKNNIEQRIKDLHSIYSFKRVLDIGCGSQPFRELLESLDMDYFGFEANPYQDADFHGRIDEELRGKINVTQQFDFIMLTEVLEHVANWDKVFSNLRRLLQKDGVVLITAPFFYQLHEEPHDFWRPTLHAFNYFAKKYDLLVIEASKIGCFWDVLGTLIANTHKISATQSNLRIRILKKIILIIRHYLLVLLVKRTFERKFEVLSAIYLSNIVVLKK